jgi:hypothetical protein
MRTRVPEENAELTTFSKISKTNFSLNHIINLRIYKEGSSIEGEIYLLYLRFYNSESISQDEIDYINGAIDYVSSNKGYYCEYAKTRYNLQEGNPLFNVIGADLQGQFPRGGSSTWSDIEAQVRGVI